MHKILHVREYMCFACACVYVCVFVCVCDIVYLPVGVYYVVCVCVWGGVVVKKSEKNFCARLARKLLTRNGGWVDTDTPLPSLSRRGHPLSTHPLEYAGPRTLVCLSECVKRTPPF